MAPRPYIDSHHHLWDLRHGRHPWLTGPMHPRRFGDYTVIRTNYLLPDLLRESAGSGLVKSVHVQANVQGDPVEETRWLQSVADQHGFPHAIVAGADLCAPDVAELLDRHLEFANVRGVRMLVHHFGRPLYNGPLRPHLMAEPAFRVGYQALRARNLSFDLPLYYTQVDEALAVLRDLPDVPVVLNHCLHPVHLDPGWEDRAGAEAAWREAVRRMAELPQVQMKLSGLWMAGRHFTAEDLRPIVRHLVESFGPGRCMVGSNFPVDKVWTTYADMMDTYRACLGEYSAAERDAMFHDNAARFYRL